MASDLQKPKATRGNYDQMVAAQLARTETRIRMLDLATGLLGLLALVLAYLGILVVLDHLLELSIGLRQLALVVLGLVVLGYVFGVVLKPFRQRVNRHYAALQVERTLPEAKNSVINWVDLHQESLPGAIHTALGRRAAKDVRKADLEEAVPARQVGWAGGLAGVLGALLLVLLIWLGPPQFFHRLARALGPFGSSQGTFSRTQLTLIRPEKGNVTLTIGRPLRVVVRVDGVVPDPDSEDRLRLLYRYRQTESTYQERLLRPLPGSSEEWVTTVAAVDVRAGFWYKIRGGDAETPEYRVQVRASLQIVDFQATYHYRPYLGRVDDIRYDRTIQALRGTEVTLQVRTNRKLTTGEVHFRDKAGVRTQQGKLLTNNPKAFQIRFVIKRSGEYRLHFKTTDEESYTDLEYHPVVAIADLAPVVVLTRPGKDIEAHANGLVELEGKASDDHGVKELTLRCRLGSNQPGGGTTLQPLPYRPKKGLQLARGGYPRSVEYKDFLDLTQLRNPAGKLVPLRAGMELEYWLEARDACDYPEPNQAESEHYRIRIIEPEQDKNKLKKKRAQAKQREQEHQKRQDQKLENEDQARERQRQEQKARQEEKARQREEQGKGEGKKDSGEGKQGKKGEGEKGSKGKGKQGSKGEGKQGSKAEGDKGEDSREARKDKELEETAKKLEEALQKREARESGKGEGKADSNPEPGSGKGAGKDKGGAERKPPDDPDGEGKGPGKDRMGEKPGADKERGNGEKKAPPAEGKDKGKPDPGGMGTARENPPPSGEGARGKGTDQGGTGGQRPEQAPPEKGTGKPDGTEGKDAGEGKPAGKDATGTSRGEGKASASRGDAPADGKPEAAPKGRTKPEPKGSGKGKPSGEKEPGKGESGEATAKPAEPEKSGSGSGRGEAKPAPGKPKGGKDPLRDNTSGSQAKPDPREQAREQARGAQSEDVERLKREMEKPGGRDEAERKLEDIARHARDVQAREQARKTLDKMGPPNRKLGQSKPPPRPASERKGGPPCDCKGGGKSGGAPKAGGKAGPKPGSRPGEGAEGGKAKGAGRTPKPGKTPGPIKSGQEGKVRKGQVKGRGKGRGGSDPGQGSENRAGGKLDESRAGGGVSPPPKRFKPGDHRATEMQLQRFKDKVDKNILKDAKLSAKDYRKFLEALRKRAERQRTASAREQLPPPIRGGPLPGMRGGLGQGSRTEADTPGTSRALAPPEYRDAHREFRKRLAERK